MAKNVSIGLISGEYPPQMGGVGDYTFHLAQALAQQGASVTVITRQTNNTPIEDEIIEGGIRIARILPPHGLSLATLKHLGTYLRRHRFNAVFYQYVPHLYGRAGINPCSALVPLVARLAGVKVVGTMFHELATRPKENPNRLKGLLLWLGQMGQAALIGQVSHRLITNNPETVARLNRLMQRLYQKKRCALLAVGSNIPLQVLGAKEREGLRQNIGITENQPLLLIFSPFTIGKDLETCLQALVCLPHAQLVCIGGKPAPAQQLALSQRAQALKVSCRLKLMAGSLDATAVSAWLQAADIYLHTADGGASGRSTALAAAMQHALPIIAYSGRQTSDLFKHDENICLVTPGKVNEMAAAITRLDSDKRLAKQLGTKAALYYQQYAAWQIIAKHFSEMVQS